MLPVTPANKPWLKHYDGHVPQAFSAPSHPLTNFLHEAVQTYPDHTALIFKGMSISYRDLSRQIDEVAGALIARGFKKGDRAVIYMPNIPQFVICYYGILKAGGIVVAVDPSCTKPELEEQLADCSAQIVFVMSLCYERLKQIQAAGKTNVKAIIVTNMKEYLPPHRRILFTLLREKRTGHAVQMQDGDTPFPDFLALGQRYPPPPLALSGDDVALIQYRKGSTDPSMGVMALHRNLVANVYQLRAWLPDARPPIHSILAAIPLFCAYGMITALHMSISLAGTLILIPDPEDEKAILAAITKHKPTIFPGTPAIFNALCINPAVAAGKVELGSIRYWLAGAAGLSPETRQCIKKLAGLSLLEGYGACECYTMTHCNPVYGPNRPGSIGLPLPGVACKVVAVDDPATELVGGEVGQLLLKGPNIMSGWWKRPNAGAYTFRDGWFHTGTLVEMDERGYFYVHSR